MREITLTNGMVSLIDTDDYPQVSQYRWYYDARSGGYAFTRILQDGKWVSVKMHQMIMGSAGVVEIDHKNTNGLDNQRDNLRPASHSQNQQNTMVSKNSKTGYKGVHWDASRGLYRAQIMKDKQTYRLGRYGSSEEAAHVYDAAARELFGEYARLNFPLPGERPARRLE